MGLFSKPQKQDFPDLPDNLYFARLAKITNKIGQTSKKPYTSWGFEIVQPPFQKRWVWANTQPTVSPKSLAGKFLTALGVDINAIDPEAFNEQTLVGTYVKVLVETTENTDGDKFQNVTKIMTILESEQPLLQQWLSQLKVTGAVKVASNPTAPHEAPVLAAAPVSFPAQPAAPAAPLFQGLPTVNPQPAPAVAAPVPAVQTAPAAAAAPKSKFPF
jgi:hypothetical protein